MPTQQSDSNAEHLLSQLWGKADSKLGSWHPAILHMLDVAAVALELLHDGLSRALVRDLEVPAAGHRLLPADIAFAVACHDLGKLTPGFQAKVPARQEVLAALGLDFPSSARRDHAESTGEIGPHLLEAVGVERLAAEYTCIAVGAHHGHFIPREVRNRLVSRVGGSLWDSVQRAAVPQLAAALSAQPRRLAACPSERWLMVLGGLTVVADWIGSDTSFFPYQPDATADAAYVTAARERAGQALRALGWRGWTAGTAAAKFADLFPNLAAPNAMQQTVIDALANVDGPLMLVVEAPTGCGKTEAALYAAEQQMATADLGGMYFALPTQATSNQMFSRVASFLRSRYPQDHVNLHLLHGLRDLNADYAAIATRSVDGAEGATTRGSAVAADAWFHGKKRGLLSPFAVGTVDQALLAALQTKHFHLRMFGLTRKVLVIDEVHAYDAFMSRILDRLLEWLSALGSTVILLSATLQRSRRQELLSAWAGGGTRASIEASTAAEASYPRLSIACRGSSTVISIPRDSVGRSSRLEFKPAQEVARLLVDRLADGGCAAWICNTVGEAQAAYLELRALLRPTEVLLFHARFPVEERLAREERVLERLSKEATRPHRLVVVATQVIEQSLDIDFDLIVSAVAPVDLLVQRAGRLHRHPDRNAARPTRLQVPALVVVEPEIVDGAVRFGPSEHVYDAHVLLRTWWSLRKREHWTIPDEADSLLDEVYDSAAPPDDAPEVIAARWRQTAEALDLALRLAKSRGAEHLVPAPQPPEAEQSFVELSSKALDDPDDSPHKHSDFLAKTRDIDTTVQLICLFDGDRLAPGHDATRVDLQNGELTRSDVAGLVRRSVSVSNRVWVRRLLAQNVPPAFARVPQLRSARAVSFDGHGQARIGEHGLRLDSDLGLILREETT